LGQGSRRRKVRTSTIYLEHFVEYGVVVDAVARVAHPLAPILNAAFDRGLSYGELAAMLAPRPVRHIAVAPPSDDRLWVELAHLYELGIEQSASPENGRKLMFDLAVLYLETLGDRRAAERHLRRILATDPAHEPALDTYLQILIEEQRCDEAADLLDRAIEAAADDDKPDLLVELASIAHEHLGQADRAIAALRAAHDWDAMRIDVLARARVILIEEERWCDVKTVLDDETAHVLAWGGEQDDAAFHSLAEAYRLLGDRICSTGVRHRLAEECFRRATLLGDLEANEKYEVMVRLGNRWPREASFCRRQGFDERDRQRAAMLHLRAAGLHLDYGENPEAAKPGLERSWFLYRNREALELIERAYLEQQRPHELLEKFRRMIESERDRAAKVELLLRAARVALRAGDDALPWYLRVLELAPENDEAQRRTDRLLAERGRHDRRAELLEARLANAAGHRERMILLELGRIYTEKLGDYARATDRLERALALDPVSFEAASMLRAIYRDTGDAEKLEGVIAVLIDYCPDRKSRQELLAEQGVRGTRLRKWSPPRSRRTRPTAVPSCMPSVPGDNLAADGGQGRAAEERPVPGREDAPFERIADGRRHASPRIRQGHSLPPGERRNDAHDRTIARRAACASSPRALASFRARVAIARESEYLRRPYCARLMTANAVSCSRR
jgi:tetratricopeptide (TPR) repeat protein